MKFRRTSIKRRLLLTLLVPLCFILIALGLSGAWFIDRVVETSSDRVLGGSLQAIAETLVIEDGYLTMDLPPSALGMLENSDRDNVYYSVTYGKTLISGYPELSISRNYNRHFDGIEFNNSTFHGVPIRMASESKLIPQLAAPVFVQVAETTGYRRAQAGRMLILLVMGELFLLVTIAVVVNFAIDWGLNPLTALRSEIEERNGEPDLNLSPLHLGSVPREVVPFVAAFNSLLNDVNKSFQTLRRFTADASHQLRAPLAVVRTHVELLSRSSAASEEIREALSDVQHSVKALQHLIVQLISLAKAERPNGDTDGKGNFDLVECAAATARNYALQALEKDIQISFEAFADELLVTGSPIFATEMIANLLDNSIRYGRPGGKVEVRLSDEPGLLVIEDDGLGVPIEDRELVFERFHRLPRNSDIAGSGLGLSIVRALGRRMGATVHLETPTSGKGLKAIIRFQTVIV
jgi:two-component system, OmpR family, sensor histidine kinase TctE